MTLGGPEFFGKWETGLLIVALYLVDEEVWNKEMGRLERAQPAGRRPGQTRPFSRYAVPEGVSEKVVESSSKSVVDKPLTTKDIVEQRQMEEEERRSKQIFDDMQRRSGMPKSALKMISDCKR